MSNREFQVKPWRNTADNFLLRGIAFSGFSMAQFYSLRCPVAKAPVHRHIGATWGKFVRGAGEMI